MKIKLFAAVNEMERDGWTCVMESAARDSFEISHL